jgi:hypothetical protein
MKPAARWVIAFLLAPVLGFLCFLLPILVTGNAEHLTADGSTLLVSRVFENAKLVPSTMLLVLAGFGLRHMGGRGVWMLSLLLIAPFPAATCLEVLTNPASHNLLPMEVAIQFGFVVPAVVGGYASRALNDWMTRETAQGSSTTTK